MPILRQLTQQHRTLLLIDSASANTQVALLRRDAAPVWCVKTGEAGELIFSGVDDVLARAGCELGAIDAFLFCDGPGSVLGIRTAAVALRTWRVLQPRPVYAYCSLALIAHALALDGRRSFAVISDARRETWHHVGVDSAGNVSPLQRMPTAALPGDLVMPEGFRTWSKLVSPAPSVPYRLESILPRIAEVDLFSATEAPDAFLHEEPVYQMWTPQVHRAPLSS